MQNTEQTYGLPEDTVESRVRVLRIVVAVMATGVIAFAVVAVVFVRQGIIATNADVATFLLPVLACVAGGQLVGYVILRSVLVKRVRETAADPAAAGQMTPRAAYTTITLIGCVMAEGTGLLGIVTYLLSANMFGLVAPGAAIILIACQWPTRDGAERFGWQ